MAGSEFLFVMRLSGREDFDHVLKEVAANVFRHLGCAAATVAELVEALNAAVAPVLFGGTELDVQFHAHPGSCDVIVVVRDREVWRTTRRLS